jgi:hypothetical protein
MKTTADHNDADLILKLYDLRRETVMRSSRDIMIMKFWPKSYEEFLAVTQPGHEYNQAFRQVSSYWEMAYGFAKHGVINADMLVESGGEGIFLYGKILPYLSQFRETGSPTAFSNTEWIVTNSKVGAQRLEMIMTRIKAMAETIKK